MNELKVFDEREVLGKAFRIYGTPDEPLFLARDVAEWIEYPHGNVVNMLRTIDEPEKLKLKILISGQNREMWFLTEDGLYEVLMQSRKPIRVENRLLRLSKSKLRKSCEPSAKPADTSPLPRRCPKWKSCRGRYLSANARLMNKQSRLLSSSRRTPNCQKN